MNVRPISTRHLNAIYGSGDAARARLNEERRADKLTGLACCALSAFVVIYFGWQFVRAVLS